MIRVVDIYNGYEWYGRTLEVREVRCDDDVCHFR